MRILFLGNYTFDCLGSGTLTVAGHTYSNVLFTRVIFDFGLQLVSYIWYVSNNGMPVFDYIPGDGFFIPEAAIYLNSVTTGIDEKLFAGNLQYNNPVTSLLNVSMQNIDKSDISYTLINSQGHLVLKGEIEKSEITQLSLNMENISAGIYCLSLYDSNNSAKKRTVKVLKITK